MGWNHHHTLASLFHSSACCDLETLQRRADYLPWWSTPKQATGNKAKTHFILDLFKTQPWFKKRRVDWIPAYLCLSCFYVLLPWNACWKSHAKFSQPGTPGCRFALHLGAQMLKKILRCNQSEHHKVSVQMDVGQEGLIEPYFLLKGSAHGPGSKLWL